MAIDLVGELFGEAVRTVARQGWERWPVAKMWVLDWLRDAAQPPAGVELRTTDGSTYTGAALFEANQLKVFVAIRHPSGTISPSHIPRHRAATPTVRGASPLGFPDPDDPRWDRDGAPFRR